MEIPDDPIRRAIGELADLRKFIRLAWQGLHSGLESRELAELLRTSLVSETREFYSQSETWERIEDEHAFAAKLRTGNFQYLYGLAVMKLWSILGVLVQDVIMDRLELPNRHAFHPKMYDLKGPLLSFADASARERAGMVYDLVLQSTNARQKPGVGRFEALLEMVGLSGPVHDQVRRQLCELAVVRNLTIHQVGIIDTRAIEVCPWIGGSPGEQVEIAPERYSRFDKATCWYVLELARRTCFNRDTIIDGNIEYVGKLVGHQHRIELDLVDKGARGIGDFANEQSSTEA